MVFPPGGTRPRPEFPIPNQEPTMATKAPETNLESLFTGEERPMQDYLAARTVAYTTTEGRRALERLLQGFDRWSKPVGNESRAAARKGIIEWILARPREAVKSFEGVRPAREWAYFQARVYLEAGAPDTAVELFQKALEFHPESALVLAGYAEALLAAGRAEEAIQKLEQVAPTFEGDAPFHHALGLAYDAVGRHEDADRAFDRALAADEGYPPTLFRRAWNLALRGNEEEALKIYERLRDAKPPHVGALINLGVMYEAYPDHERARLYLRDANAAMNMFYDEEIRRRESGWKRVLATPVTELPFSLRTRNSLEKAGILTLGDLVRQTEEDLKANRSLGASGLKEIVEILQARGLSLSTATAKPPSPEVADGPAPAAADVLARNLDEFEWSARSKKALAALGLATVGDLVRRSEKDFASVKNFGATSLTEVKQKLAALGLSLRTDE
jgi:DNA-directed RNA polymerase subunit alpha